MDRIDSGPQKKETREQIRDWNFHRKIWKLESLVVFFNNGKLFEETKNKNDTNPNLVRDFCSTAFLRKPYGYSFLICAFTYGCGPALGKLMYITIFVIAGPLDDILSWPVKRTIQISTFGQGKSGLTWTKFRKIDNKTSHCFSRPSTQQPHPSCCIFFYLPHEGMCKTYKNLIKNDNEYIQIMILDFL